LFSSLGCYDCVPKEACSVWKHITLRPDLWGDLKKWPKQIKFSVVVKWLWDIEREKQSHYRSSKSWFSAECSTNF
jgi:hypothetical protein